LILGCDLTKIDKQSLSILSNEEIIAVNQDKLGISGKRIHKEGLLIWRTELWAGPLENNCVAAVLFNSGYFNRNIIAKFSNIKFNYSQGSVRDLINHKDLGVFSKKYSAKVPSHSVVMVKICPTGE